jgi:parallel beta-helix repeat protein
VISNCTTGVRAQSAERVELESNEIRDCDYGILLADSPSMSMVANTLVGCGLYIESDLITGWSTHTIDSSNSVNGGALVYLVSTSGAALPASSGQVVLAGCSWITASSLDLSDCTVGVLAGFSNHITVIGCNLSDNQLGAEFANCADSSVLSNTISDCALEGVRLRGSRDNAVEDNVVLRCGIGIRVSEGLLPSTGNLVSGNNASHCTHGVMVSSSPETTVERNVLLSALVGGVMVGMSNHTVVRNNTCNGSGDMAVSVWGSGGCTISNNSFSVNHRGIYLWSSVRCNISGNVLYGSMEYGVRLDSASKNNAVWDNVFAYNNGTTESYDPLRAQACDDGIGNRWNTSDAFGGLGNYWHDLTAPDDDLDGVVDVPYNVSGTARAKDHRPLANASVSIEQMPEHGPFPAVACLGLLAPCPDRRKWD